MQHALRASVIVRTVAGLCASGCVALGATPPQASAPLSPKVDAIPGLEFNQFQTGAAAPVEVAVLSTRRATDPGYPDFDATRVDARTVRFGPRLVPPLARRLADVDHDGDLDAVFTFDPVAAGLGSSTSKAKILGSLPGSPLFSVSFPLMPVRTNPLDPTLPRFTVFTNRSDSLLLAADRPDGYTVRYFGTRDQAGHPAHLDVVEVRRPDGKKDIVQYDFAGRPLRVVVDGSSTFSFTWASQSRALVVFTDPAGAQVRTFFDLHAPLNAALQGPPARASSRLGVPSELVFVPGGSAPPQPFGLAAAAAESAATATVSITRCGGRPVDDAQLVNFTVLSTRPPQPGQPVESLERWASLRGGGVYAASIPVQGPSTVAESIGSACETLAEALGVACDLGGDIAEFGDAICAELVDLANSIPSPGGRAVAEALAVACAPAFHALDLSCKTLGASPAPGAPSVADTLCAGLRAAVDAALAGDTLIIQARALVPSPSSGLVLYSSPAAQAPAAGPLPPLAIDAGGALSVVSFSTSPFDPAPYQGYVASAQLECVPPSGIDVVMSIHGTDGYGNSAVTHIAEDGTATLYVPGAEPGVVDTITVNAGGGQVSRTITIVF